MSICQARAAVASSRPKRSAFVAHRLLGASDARFAQQLFYRFGKLGRESRQRPDIRLAGNPDANAVYCLGFAWTTTMATPSTLVLSPYDSSAGLIV